MLSTLDVAQQRSLLLAAGFEEVSSMMWLASLETLYLPAVPTPDRLDSDAEIVAPLFITGWDYLNNMPLRSKRSDKERRAGELIISTMNDLCWRFSRAHRRVLYDRLTNVRSASLRTDELLWRGAELWPGLLPSRKEVTLEAERMQMDKDGREINQGMFISQMLSDQQTGNHLMMSMLKPHPQSVAMLEDFIKTGSVQLEGARVEARGEVGYIYNSNPDYLNAMDQETLLGEEIAIDLVLLHPQLRMGVLRGDVVNHPKYQGRHVFSSGINLTKIYHGKIPYLYYLLRELGLMHKLYRGLAPSAFFVDEAEDTLEKPWMAIVDTFAIGGGCQLLLVVDYVIAEKGSYFNLPARKEGIIPGAANMRLPRFMGEGLAREAIMFDRRFSVEEPAARMVVNEVHPATSLDAAAQEAVDNALSSGMVSASGNRKGLRVETEPLATFRQYMATYAREQAFCHFSDQLIHNLEKHWQARNRNIHA